MQIDRVEVDTVMEQKSMQEQNLGTEIDRLLRENAELKSRLQLEQKRSTDSEARFRLLVQHSNDIITTIDENAVQTSISGPIEKIIGYAAEELERTSGFDLIHPDDRPAVMQIFMDALQEPGSSRRLEYRYRHKNGGWIWMETVGVNLLHDPAVRGIVLNIRDISERKRFQEQLQQAMKMEAIGRLAGGIAHDFNNLLTVISGHVDLARMDLAPADPILERLKKIGKAAQNASLLTRQLLAFSRRQMIEPKVISLNDLVGTLNKILARIIGEDIDIRTVLTMPLDSVKVDPGQFEQVLINLAVNARDAMPNGGRLVIETANMELDEHYCAGHTYVKPGRYVMLAVSDTGHGMTAEVKERLFEPFFTTKPKGQGTGLGLATIFGAVKQSKGSIEVYSEVGHGTTFRIYLPKFEGEAGKFAKDEPEACVPQGNETVLLVEDEASVRGLAQTILERLGYKVLCAVNGHDALQVMESHQGRVDLVITDIVMPGMNGRELAERLLRLYPEMKVLFTSGYTENVIMHHGVIEEKLNFIGKPYAVAALAQIVRRILHPPAH